MEKKITPIPGILVVFIQLALVGLAIYTVYSGWNDIEQNYSLLLLPIGYVVVACILFGGYVTLEPNDAAIIAFMGKYKGTLKENGFWYINPFYGSRQWSLRVSNYAMDALKVNDKNGVPIEIAATIVWRIGDTYKAQYDVDDVNEYIDNQFEISLRNLAKKHTYAELSREDKDFVADLTDKVSKAGIEILDAKITHLNYAPEIAAAMLQKQQASSLSEAKEIIVSTAVHIAQNAAAGIPNMNNDQKAKFISDLIVVLCSEKAVSPVLAV